MFRAILNSTQILSKLMARLNENFGLFGIQIDWVKTKNLWHTLLLANIFHVLEFAWLGFFLDALKLEICFCNYFKINFGLHYKKNEEIEKIEPKLWKKEPHKQSVPYSSQVFVKYDWPKGKYEHIWWIRITKICTYARLVKMTEKRWPNQDW